MQEEDSDFRFSGCKSPALKHYPKYISLNEDFPPPPPPPDRSCPLLTNPTAAVLLLLLGAASSLRFPPTHQATSRASPHSVTILCTLSGRSALGTSQDPLCLQPGTQLCEPPMILGAPHNPLCPTAWLSAFCASPNPPVPPMILSASHDPFCLP